MRDRKAYNEKRRDSRKVSGKKWEEEHKEERSEYSKNWYQCNKAHKQIYQKIRNDTRKGFVGKYRGKNFCYKEKLPEGMVRHHQFYNDNNPNDGIVYMSMSNHMKLHRSEETFMKIGGWVGAWEKKI